jgi:hypothetical protein
MGRTEFFLKIVKRAEELVGKAIVFVVYIGYLFDKMSFMFW